MTRHDERTRRKRSDHRAQRLDYDVIVIGSGFGGSVAAMRAVEKGSKTEVLEAGKRFGGTMLMCPCHGSQFDVTSGAVLRGPATVPLATYDVREVDGEIQLRA